ncbi:hypothetical protein J6590_063884 [Homalodisca vitripennis]|nr:hypothetical protein J6590_063884 [Homalodisca vitripennis]
MTIVSVLLVVEMLRQSDSKLETTANNMQMFNLRLSAGYIIFADMSLEEVIEVNHKYGGYVVQEQKS